MEPEIQTGALAYVNTHVPVEEIKEGDIIGFKVNEDQVTHRVIKINDDNTFITKGDANENEDLSPVSFSNYLGKTIYTIPKLGSLVSKAKSKDGVFVISVIMGLNIILVFFEENEEENEKNKQKKCDKNKKKNKTIINENKEDVDFKE